ncbi:DNA translocase FtsK 4TM domain-containing protein [Blastochloris sulfoviridis]
MGMQLIRRRWLVDLLTEEVIPALRRFASQLAGLTILSAVLAMTLALATWSVNDPSINHATSGPARNLLGTPGAVVADLVMQLVGVAALALLIPIAVLGWRLVSGRPSTRERLRLVLWLAGTVLAAAAAACLPAPATWPLPSGLGGIVGDAVLRGFAWIAGPLDAAGRPVVATPLSIAAIAAVLAASGLGFGRTADHAAAPAEARFVVEERDTASVSLGYLAHWFYAGRAALMRRLRRRPPPPALRPAPWLPPADERREPEPPRPPVWADDGEPAAAAAPAPARSPEVLPPTRGPARGIKTSRARAAAEAQPALEPEAKFELPAVGLLAAPKGSGQPALSQGALQETSRLLEGVLDDFGVRGGIIGAHPGPVVTLYELEPAPGIKSSRVIGLAEDIARSMSAISARVAVVPGRNVIGIELPNPKREKVLLRELLASPSFAETKDRLPLCLGKTIGGEPVVVDLARMPHLLIAGTTGSGKSVAINTMILSLLYRHPPKECRLIMVDPKMLELSVYDGIPHLLTPVVTDPKKAVVALKWAVREMEDRYKKMSKLGVRNIDGFNARVAEAAAKGQCIVRTVQTGFDKETGEAIYEREEMDCGPLPFIVVIVDEMADLMLVAGKDIEGAIQRLAQMARAAGIHLVMATQRPSVDVITGTIKANFPTRISFQVTSKIDSRTILGEQGAEQLLGQGDMLYMAGGGRISRVHGPFVSDAEVERVVAHLKAQGAPDYLDAVTAQDDEESEDGAVFDKTAMGGEGGGDLYSQAVEVVVRDRKASTSYIQRRLQIGYNRAASLMERMEKDGIVGPANHAGKREILIEADNDSGY